MDTLSRREEEALMKTTKARAQKECDPVIKGCSQIFYMYTANLSHCVDAYLRRSVTCEQRDQLPEAVGRRCCPEILA